MAPKLIKKIIARDKTIFLVILGIAFLCIYIPELFVKTRPPQSRQKADKQVTKDLFHAEISRYAAVERTTKNKEKIRLAGFVMLILGYPGYLFLLMMTKKRNPFFVEEKVMAAEESRARAELLKRQREIEQVQKKRQEFANRLNTLGKHLGDHQSAKDFHTWFYDFLDFLAIPNQRPHMQEDRQINGTLTVSGITYLVELKFAISPMDQGAISDFFKKVTFHNTRGLFLSISGFTEKAKKSASFIRPPLLLLDSRHLDCVLNGTMAMGEIIDQANLPETRSEDRA